MNVNRPRKSWSPSSSKKPERLFAGEQAAHSSLDLVAGTYRIDAAVHTRNSRSFDYRRGCVRFIVGSRVHDVGIYRPQHEWRFEGGITFKAIDMLKQNVPAPIAEYIRQTEGAKKK